MRKARAQMDGGGEQKKFAEGDTVNVISPHMPEHEGASGTVVSAQCGPYYAIDLGGDGPYRWYAESELGGQPSSNDAPTQTPTEPAPSGDPAAARGIARLAGGDVGAQLEVARLAALGRDVLARTGAATPGAALVKIEAALVALEEIGPLRAAEKKRTAADADRQKREAESAEERERRDILAAGVASGALTRAQAFDVALEEHTDSATGRTTEREVLTPKAAWKAGSVADLRAQISALGASPRAPGARQEPSVTSSSPIPASVQRIAEARGYTPEQTQRFAALQRKTARRAQET